MRDGPVLSEHRIYMTCTITAVARLKNGGETVRLLLKNGRSVRPRYHFYLSRSPYVSLKEI